MKFLGIDLGWRSQPSGLCCLAWEDNQLHLLDLNRQEAIEDILNWVDTWAPCPLINTKSHLPHEAIKADEQRVRESEGSLDSTSPLFPCSPAPLQTLRQQNVTSDNGESDPAMIAVDAPTLIPNATGTRLPDKLTHKYFGRYHAGCYPANLSLAFAQRTVSFGLELEARGFAHAPTIKPQQLGRFQIEVFPHPATVHLFRLERILKYKKGRLSERRSELMKLHQYILDILPTLIPCLNPSTLSSSPMSQARCLYLVDAIGTEFPSTGAALKALEDKLDALICAYVAAHWWYWGLERNLVLGDATTGYIVVPAALGEL